MRTLEFPVDQLETLDATITEQLLPALAGRRLFSDGELSLLRLPCRLGGIGLPSFQSVAAVKFDASCAITSGQVEEILHQQDESWQARSCDFISDLA